MLYTDKREYVVPRAEVYLVKIGCLMDTVTMKYSQYETTTESLSNEMGSSIWDDDVDESGSGNPFDY